jgi:hypothetical protein
MSNTEVLFTSLFDIQHSVFVISPTLFTACGREGVPAKRRPGESPACTAFKTTKPRLSEVSMCFKDVR